MELSVTPKWFVTEVFVMLTQGNFFSGHINAVITAFVGGFIKMETVVQQNRSFIVGGQVVLASQD